MRHLLATSSTVALVLGAAAPAAAQHADHADHTDHADHADDTDDADHADHGASHHGGVLGIPMSRHGSGTSWLPDDAPVRAAHARAGGWDLMLHANLFAGYDHQATDAGDAHLVSQNWLMAMASRDAGGGRLQARTMLSLEPLTVGDEGYPLLLQTGETRDGRPLVDRQHPHDLFMELAAIYERPLTADVGVQVYGALAGEPAVGPTAFPHRPAAMANPMAPLGHHWIDSTHISFGVLTAGVFTRTAKLEASWFNGREPDEDRLDLDLAGFDSVAARLSINPSSAWSLQASYAYLASPERLEPEVSVQRFTASAIHARALGRRRAWTSTLAAGVNAPSEGVTTPALLAETALDLGHLGVTFARAEALVKTGHDFDLGEAMHDVELPIAALALGHVHPIVEVAGAEAAIGVQGSIAYAPAELEARYGTRAPLGVMAFIQLQPAASSTPME